MTIIIIKASPACEEYKNASECHSPKVARPTIENKDQDFSAAPGITTTIMLWPRLTGPGFWAGWLVGR
jgi:hypothetical protein